MASNSTGKNTGGKTRNFFVWIIMGLLFVGLIGFGATGLTGTVRSIGSVGDKPITTQAYYQELQGEIRVRSAQEGRAISFPEAQAAGLPARALERVVGQRALDNQIAELGVSVGDEIISRQVLAEPAFRGPDGAFDRTAYREALARSGLSVREYEDQLRDAAARALLQGAVFTGIPDPQTYANTLAGFSREERSFTWATVTEADVDLTALPAPTDDELQAYYEANPSEFTSPETRVIRYVWLTPDMIQDDVPVDEAELRLEYDARIEEYQQPERRLVEQLAFSTEEAAAEALAQIEAGETTFPDLVEARGLSLNDVDLGDVTEAQMRDAGAAIFAAENGDVVGPFASDLGPALYRMNAVLAARNTTFEEALPELREDQAAARARRMIEDQIDPIIDLLAGGVTLEDLADQTDMELGSIDWTADTTTGIAAYATFRDAAAAAETGDFPELLDLDDGGIFALQLEEILSPAVIPFEEVRDDVVAGFEAERDAQAVSAEAEARAGQLREAVQDFAALGLEAQEESELTRGAFLNGTPPSFISEVFAMETGDVRVVPNGDSAIVVRLDAVADADMTDDAFVAEAAQLAESGGEGIAQDIYLMFTRTVQVETDVSLNQAAINAVHANFQ